MEISIRVSDTLATDKVRAMADPNLSESAWQRAKEDAAGVYSSIAFQTGGALVTLIVGAVAAVVSANESSTVQIAIPVLGGAVAIGMSFLAVLLFQVVAAPVRQRNALRNAWPSSADPPSDGVNVKLWSLYRKGCDLAIRLEATPVPERDWVAAEKWADDVGALLGSAVPEETARAFFVVGENETDLYWQVSERASKLKEIIERLGQIPPTS